MIREALQVLLSGEHLTAAQMRGAFAQILEGNATPAQIGGLAMALWRPPPRRCARAVCGSAVPHP
jgi:anthranilate phosphoribosyltransferase